jgi:EAL domain-containing protein (putative c-di-GMP-specific phosphodiesterase class I)
MSTTATDPLLTGLAARWADQLFDTAFIAMGAEELREFLADQVATLAVALCAEPFTDEPGVAVGNALVTAKLIAPESLQRSVAVLAELPGLLDIDGRGRIGPLLGAIAAGFTRALQEQILGDQERILRAALSTLDADERDLVGRLPSALEHGEFALVYQPLVSLVDGRLRGAESLLRWHHPSGTLSPNTFIPIAEQSGLIGLLGAWVLRESCAQAARWQARFPSGSPLISVNVSGHQWTDPGLFEEVTSVLADTGLEPTNLQLELTETVLMGSYDRPAGGPVQTMRALAQLGVRIVIDDFGIGYSNLAYLRHLPVHGLKLAGAFMAGIRAPASDRVDEQIVETVIRLAHTLGMTVTAEGIETADQAHRLAALGCDLGQGWHYGRPGAADRIA